MSLGLGGSKARHACARLGLDGPTDAVSSTRCAALGVRISVVVVSVFVLVVVFGPISPSSTTEAPSDQVSLSIPATHPLALPELTEAAPRAIVENQGTDVAEERARILPVFPLSLPLPEHTRRPTAQTAIAAAQSSASVPGIEIVVPSVGVVPVEVRRHV